MTPRTKREYLHELVANKNRWSGLTLTEAERKLGFLGWHERGYLPHCDFPGLVQFVTFRLADSMPAARTTNSHSRSTSPAVIASKPNDFPPGSAPDSFIKCKIQIVSGPNATGPQTTGCNDADDDSRSNAGTVTAAGNEANGVAERDAAGFDFEPGALGGFVAGFAAAGAAPFGVDLDAAVFVASAFCAADANSVRSFEKPTAAIVDRTTTPIRKFIPPLFAIARMSPTQFGIAKITTVEVPRLEKTSEVLRRARRQPAS